MALAAICAAFDEFFPFFLIPVDFTRVLCGLFVDFVVPSFDSLVVLQG
jgi:hypothetical protein